MTKLKGIILAAGGSYRLLPLTENIPKCLLEITPNRTILEELVISSYKVVDECYVIGGHGFNTLQAHVNQLVERYGFKMETIYNSKYKTTNNCYSLYFGLTELKNQLSDADVCVLNSDVIVDPQIMNDLAKFNKRTDHSILVIDKRDTLTREDMKVKLSPKGRIVKISKELTLTEADGEFIGISIIKSGDLSLFRDVLLKTSRHYPQGWYEHGYQALIDQGYDFQYITTSGRYWTEIDTIEDLKLARKRFQERNKNVE